MHVYGRHNRLILHNHYSLRPPSAVLARQDFVHSFFGFAHYLLLWKLLRGNLNVLRIWGIRFLSEQDARPLWCVRGTKSLRKWRNVFCSFLKYFIGLCTQKLAVIVAYEVTQDEQNVLNRRAEEYLPLSMRVIHCFSFCIRIRGRKSNFRFSLFTNGIYQFILLLQSELLLFIWIIFYCALHGRAI